MHSLWIIGVENKFATELKTRMNTVSFRLVVSSDKGDLGFPVYGFALDVSHCLWAVRKGVCTSRFGALSWSRKGVSSASTNEITSRSCGAFGGNEASMSPIVPSCSLVDDFLFSSVVIGEGGNFQLSSLCIHMHTHGMESTYLSVMMILPAACSHCHSTVAHPALTGWMPSLLPYRHQLHLHHISAMMLVSTRSVTLTHKRRIAK